MATFRNCHHDFPRLAKQSGYFFQLHRGKVNWSEIENLNIDDIIDNKNFQMLEKNLINVINCNLEREYDLKILDRNFVKLFKLAQLGVDYLAYCELYLDRCVVLLQEQLIALQEEYELLKRENAKKNEELKKSRKKSRTQSYQCEECDKVFISEIYLKCHEKRRHFSPKTGSRLEGVQKKFIDKYQQTEVEEKHQRFLLHETHVEKLEDKEEIEIIKKENKIKIENLEKELEDVKTRLKKAENTLTTKSEVPISNVSSSPNLPGPVFYPPMFHWVPPYLPYSRNNFLNYTQGLVSENHQKVNPDINDFVNSRPAASKFFSDDQPVFNLESKNNLYSKTFEGENEGTNEKESKSDISSTLGENTIQNKNVMTNSRRKMDSEKENIDPKGENVFANSGKPLPLPRKIKTFFQTDVEPDIEEQSLVERTPREDYQLVSESFNHDSIAQSSTPFKEKQEAIMNEKTSSHLRQVKPENLSASFSSKEVSSVERKPKSFFKKILVKKTPKFHELSKNLRISLTSLCDSVSNGGKDSGKGKESRSVVMSGLNEELRNLGVDPEWSGIPKNTVHQKIKILKYRRKLLSKDNPLYPVVRKGIEKKILKRLDNCTNLYGEKNIRQESNEQESMETQSPALIEQIFTNNKKKETVLTLDDETESESEFNNLEVSSNANWKQRIPLEKGDLEKDVSVNGDLKPEKEFDFSVFQVSKDRDSRNSVRRDALFGNVEDLEIDSDLDSQLEDFDNYGSQLLEKSIKNNERTNTNENMSLSEFPKGKHQSTLKSTLGSISKPETGLKKKVVFIDLSDNKEGETVEVGRRVSSTRPATGNEDTWASKSGWDSAGGTIGDVG